jgi:hypothetical protein
LVTNSGKRQKWFEREREKRRKCQGNQLPMLAHILHDCDANRAQITKRHNALSDVVRRAIEKYKVQDLKSNIQENTIIREEQFSEEEMNQRPDLVLSHEQNGEITTEIIEMSCPYGRRAHNRNTLDRPFEQKRDKYQQSAEEVARIREHRVRITPVI